MLVDILAFIGGLFLMVSAMLIAVYYHARLKGELDSDAQYEFEFEGKEHECIVLARLVKDNTTRVAVGQKIGLAIVMQDYGMIDKIIARLNEILQTQKEGTV